MNPDPNNQTPQEPRIITPQWQYTSGQLSQQQHPVPQPPTPPRPPASQTSQPASAAPPAQPVPQPQPAQPAQPIQTEQPINPPVNQATNNIYKPTNNFQQAPQNVDHNDSAIYSWQASEFAANEKNSSWYLVLVVAALLISAVTFLITREYLSIIVIVVLAIAVGFYGNIKPRLLSYSIEDTGIKVGNKFYAFNEFKSFFILSDMAVPSINLVPIKKLMMPIGMYVAPSDLDKVADILGNYLPFEEKQRDFADKLSHRLRF